MLFGFTLVISVKRLQYGRIKLGRGKNRVYIEMSFGERCQLFQHFKFLCQVRIFSSNYIILIFWSIHVWYMVIRVIGKKDSVK